jgi:hypothetical protein
MQPGGVGRAGDRPDSAGDAVRPVLPADAPHSRTGGRSDAGQRESGRQDAANAPQDRTAVDGEQLPHDAGGSRALVPVVPPSQPKSSEATPGAAAGAQGHVPVASAPRSAVPLSAGAKLLLHSAGRLYFDGGVDVPFGRIEDSESSARIPPATAAAASDSYRRHGGLPPLGIQSGRVFRLSI